MKIHKEISILEETDRDYVCYISDVVLNIIIENRIGPIRVTPEGKWVINKELYECLKKLESD